MEKTKVLFVSQDITPYLKDSPMGHIARYLPQGIQERGREIRTFMPKFGNINERRNQLHEVIRLSGMNLIIDDTDNPLIIKVASIQSARMQIYFIDNEDFFQRKYVFRDKNNIFYSDNDERAIFFSRGVLDTVKKLGWPPDLVHCHGWMTSFMPIYIKKAYHENPLLSNTKVVLSIYDDHFDETLDANITNKIKHEGISAKDLKHYKKPTFANIMKAGIDFADGIIVGSPVINSEVHEYALQSGKPMLEYQPEETFVDTYNEFYDRILSA
ncbi:MAG TPA: glycogen/starch synthase [Bacteroidales bacterium]|nr:glycogen/starch synthase [Bacteroidales bacterium]